jgi:hypothetical protein
VNPSKSKHLIVEGSDDLHSVVGLMRAHVTWPQPVAEAPVWIDIGKSAEEILEAGYLTAKIKTRDLQILGVMLDADVKPRGRYERIRGLCSELFPNLPEELPSSGLIADNDSDKRFGLWIMPDNGSEGSLETFLRHLVPDESEPLWKHAVQSVKVAKATGSRCRDCHDAKANLYTWLAWQDPPGQSPGLALTKKILDPQSDSAGAFVKWFRQLYRL